MSLARQLRRRREGGIRRPRGQHAVFTDRDKGKKLRGLLQKCDEPHPHRDCPATCLKHKGHLGKHVGYVFKGKRDNKTGQLIVEKRIEVHWTDKEARDWKEAQEKAQEESTRAGAEAVAVRSTDGKEWTDKEIEPAKE